MPIDTPLEELFEESIVEDRQSKDFSEESPSPEEKFDDLDKEAADELKDIDEQGLDPSRGETESNMAAEDDPENSGERALPQADVDAPEVEAQPDGDGASDPAQLEAGEVRKTSGNMSLSLLLLARLFSVRELAMRPVHRPRHC